MFEEGLDSLPLISVCSISESVISVRVDNKRVSTGVEQSGDHGADATGGGHHQGRALRGARRAEAFALAIGVNAPQEKVNQACRIAAKTALVFKSVNAAGFEVVVVWNGDRHDGAGSGLVV